MYPSLIVVLVCLRQSQAQQTDRLVVCGQDTEGSPTVASRAHPISSTSRVIESLKGRHGIKSIPAAIKVREGELLPVTYGRSEVELSLRNTTQ